MAESPDFSTPPPEGVLADAERLLLQASQLVVSGRPDSAGQALRSIEQAIMRLKTVPVSAPIGLRLAEAWLQRGQILQMIPRPEALAEATRSRREAVAVLTPFGATGDDILRLRLGQAWLQLGGSLAAQRAKNSPVEATEAFDQAIAVLGQVSQEAPVNRHALAAAWMNRAQVVRSSPEAGGVAEAINSWDQALTLLETLPLDQEPRLRSDLAVACLNRSQLFLTPGQGFSAAEAARLQERALSLLESLPDKDTAPWRHRLASARLNYAQALTGAENAALQAQAAAVAQEALTQMEPDQREGPPSAEVALKARQVLCNLLGLRLGTPVGQDEALSADVSTASDLVDEALELIRHWEQKGQRAFRPLAGWFLQFGGHLLRVHQPHFLAEFLLENLDPSRAPGAIGDQPQLLRLGGELLARSRQELLQGGFGDVGSEEGQRIAATLEELRVAEARLGELFKAAQQPATQTRGDALPAVS